MNKKITTIDELAVMIDKSFVGVESRIAGVEARLDGIETRLTGVEGQLASFKAYVEGRFDDISRELKENRNYIKEADVRPAVVSLEVRVDKIERGMKFQA